MTEAGLAACVISDFRDECHGRFLALSNFLQSRKHAQTDCALVLLITPREEAICRNFMKNLPGHQPVIIIQTDDSTPLGTIDLLYKMSQFVAVYGEEHLGSNPNDPVNNGGFDKRVFRDGVRFKSDFKHFGPLTLSTGI